MIEVNEGGFDRVARIVLGVVLIWMGFTGVIAGALGTIVGILGLVPLITGIAGWCPLYSVLGIRTCRVKQG